MSEYLDFYSSEYRYSHRHRYENKDTCSALGGVQVLGEELLQRVGMGACAFYRPWHQRQTQGVPKYRHRDRRKHRQLRRVDSGSRRLCQSEREERERQSQQGGPEQRDETIVIA